MTADCRGTSVPSQAGAAITFGFTCDLVPRGNQVSASQHHWCQARCHADPSTCRPPTLPQCCPPVASVPSMGIRGSGEDD